MIVIQEGKQKFSFGNSWNYCFAYDNCKDEEKLRNSIPGSKCVDFLGIKNNDLYLIEIKDFRGYELDNLHRITAKPKPKFKKDEKEEVDDLAIEIAQKARDTISGIVGAVKKSTNNEEEFKQALQCLTKPEFNVFIIGIVYYDPTAFGNLKIEEAVKNLNNRLKVRTAKWLHCKTLVLTPFSSLVNFDMTISEVS